MYILGIETTGPLGSVALIDSEGKIISRTSHEKMNHLKDLMKMCQEVVDEAGIKKTELTAMAASTGPGSFTGIRIGVSSARAIAQVLKIPCIAVETLDLFKQKARGDRKSGVCPIFDARRNQVYGALFDGCGEDILKPGPYMLHEVLETIKDSNLEKVCFFGDGIDAYLDKVVSGLENTGVEVVFAPAEDRYQNGALVAMGALEKYNKGQLLQVQELVPNYMRVAEAETKLKNGILAKEREAKMRKFRV